MDYEQHKEEVVDDEERDWSVGDGDDRDMDGDDMEVEWNTDMSCSSA